MKICYESMNTRCGLKVSQDDWRIITINFQAFHVFCHQFSMRGYEIY